MVNETAKTVNANRPVHRIPVPSGLSSCLLLAQEIMPKASRDAVTGDVRQKYMPPATADFESHADLQGIWHEAMTLRTTEAKQQEYPEAEITTISTLPAQ